MHYPGNRIKVPRFNEANGFYTTKRRSNLMKRIKSQDSKPEIIVRKALWNMGYRYRKNMKSLPGRPDIVFVRKRLVIFIDGEFWHGYKWEEKKNRIKSNRDFWIPKIERNIQRDLEINQLLRREGWQVMRFWQHEVQVDLDKCLHIIIKFLNQ